jgi:deoxyribonuclease IV
MNIYGVHINSDPNNILEELDKVKNIGGNLVQLFVNPGYKKQDIYKQFREKLIKNNMHCVVHASYTINLSSYWDQYSWSIKQFIMELELAHKIGAFGIVVHMGKQMELSKEEAYNNMFTGLLYVHNQTKKDYGNIRILLETPTGQGSEICYKIEDFAHFYKKLSHHNNQTIKDRFRICFDTCHIFAAGYDIRSKEKLELYLDTFEELIGIKNIALIHLNDSKNEIGSKKDRHEALGKGYIGKDALKLAAKFFKKLNIPIVLETPESGLGYEVKEYLV